MEAEGYAFLILSMAVVTLVGFEEIVTRALDSILASATANPVPGFLLVGLCTCINFQISPSILQAIGYTDQMSLQ